MIIISGNASKVGHYSPGIISHGMLYVSGQLPIDHSTGKLVSGGIAEQTNTALHNMEQVLKAAGITKESVVMCRIYVPDVKLWDEVNRIYAEYFGDHRPARVIVPTTELHHGALIEIEAMAEMPEQE